MYVILWPKGELFFYERGNLFHICGRIHEKKYGIISSFCPVGDMQCFCKVDTYSVVLLLFLLLFYCYYYNNFRLFACYVALQETQEFVKKCMDI